MNYLVTGGSGYLGSALIKYLLNKSKNVLNFDILENHLNKSNYYKGNILNYNDIYTATKNIDIVIHNLAKVPITKSKKDFFKVNLLGTENLLKSAKKNNIKKIIFISSSAVYGIPKKVPILEDDARLPIEGYGLSKKKAEDLCFEYIKSGLDITIIRPRTIIGESRLGIFSILFDWINENKNVPILNHGKNLYQFIDIRDMVSAIHKSSLLSGSNVFNVGAEKFVSMHELISSLIIHANSNSIIKNIDKNIFFKLAYFFSKINLIPLQDYHFKIYGETVFFDISKSKKILGWLPKFSNAESIISSYDSYIINKDKKYISNKNSPHSSTLSKGLLKYAHLFY